MFPLVPTVVVVAKLACHLFLLALSRIHGGGAVSQHLLVVNELGTMVFINHASTVEVLW